MKTVVITGATGNIGKIVATELLAAGNKVRVVARHADKLQELVAIGAEAAPGDLRDASFLKQAFSGADAVLCITPGDPQSPDPMSELKQIVQNYIDAVTTNGVKYVILMSSVGAHLRKGAGMVDGSGYMEERFSELHDVNVLNLRPTYFMENIFAQIGTIKQFGIAGSTVKADLKFPAVATKDIAVVVLKRLSALNFTGNIIEYVLGERDISYNEITPIIGRAIGKPDLKYVQFPYEGAKNNMVSSGFCSPAFADLMNGLAEGMNNGTVLNAHTRTAENTTPTSIEEFAKTFAYVFNMK